MRITLLIICIVLILSASAFSQNGPVAPAVQPVIPAVTRSADHTGSKIQEAPVSNDVKTPSNAVIKDAVLQDSSDKENVSAKKSSLTRHHRKSNHIADRSTLQMNTVDNKAAVPEISIRENLATTAGSITLPDQPKNRPDKIASLAGLGEAPVKNDSSLTGKALFSTFMALLLVLGLAYGTILLIKWVSGQRGMTPSGSGKMRVLESARLSQTGTIHIVNVKGKRLLIGSASGQVTLLQELEPDDEEEQVAEESSNFAGYLEKYSKAGNGETPASRIAGFLRDSSQQLKEKYKAHNSSKTGGGKES